MTLAGGGLSGLTDKHLSATFCLWHDQLSGNWVTSEYRRKRSRGMQLTLVTKGSSGVAKINLKPQGLNLGTSFPSDKGRISFPLLFLENMTEAACQAASIYQVPSYTLKWREGRRYI